MTKRPDWFIYAYQKEPDINDLKQVLENKELDMTDIEHRLMAIALKYRAMTHVPTTIEKTMTTEQLFDAQNILWTREYTIRELYNYVLLQEKSRDYKRIDKAIRMGFLGVTQFDLLQSVTVAETPAQKELICIKELTGTNSLTRKNQISIFSDKLLTMMTSTETK